jgi:hypothetical protein
MLVAQTCNPKYSGGRDQEDHSLNVMSKYFTRPYIENTQYKKGLVEWLKW